MLTEIDQLDSLPDALESPSSKLVYLYLTVTGEATMTELRQTLGLSKLTLYRVLDSLAASGFIHHTETGYACR